MTDLEFDRHLGQLLRRYPDLRTEIEQSVVRDVRHEMVVREMVERSSEMEIEKE